ncbi:MAG: manganese efflux pump MntP [Chloroflexota bacterium]
MSRNVTTDLKLIVLVLSLGLDTLVVAVALGISGLGRLNRLRVGVSFALFEGGMPVIGFFVGRAASGVLGDIASFAGAAVLFGVGVYIVYESLSGREDADFAIESWRGLLLTSLSVSLDELVVGFSMGALDLPVALAVILIACQAFILTLAGTALGNRIGEGLAERAELVAGVVLAGLAVVLVSTKIAGVG